MKAYTTLADTTLKGKIGTEEISAPVVSLLPPKRNNQKYKVIRFFSDKAIEKNTIITDLSVTSPVKPFPKLNNLAVVKKSIPFKITESDWKSAGIKDHERRFKNPKPSKYAIVAFI